VGLCPDRQWWAAMAVVRRRALQNFLNEAD